MSTGLVQRLVETAYAFYTASAESQQYFEQLHELLPQLTVKHLGLACGAHTVWPFAKDIVYIDLIEHKSFSCGAFILKKGAELPLHDHPGMTVFRYSTVFECHTDGSRVVCGKLQVESLHWKLPVTPPPPDSSIPEPLEWLSTKDADQSQPSTQQSRLFLDSRTVWPVSIVDSAVLTSESPEIGLVLPNARNLHHLKALTNVVLFDIIGPPYDDKRVCSYFKKIHAPEKEGTWITKMDLDFDCDYQPYAGEHLQLDFVS